MAVALGYRSIRELLDGMSATEIQELEALYMLEPFGPEIFNHQMGLVCSTVMNAHITSSKQKPFNPDIYIVRVSDDDRKHKFAPKKKAMDPRAVLSLFTGG